MPTIISPFFNTDNFADVVATTLSEAYDVTSVVVGTTTYIYVTSQQEDGIQIFTLNGNGTLSVVDHVPDDVDNALNGATAIESVTVGSSQYILATGITDQGISAFLVNSDGSLTHTDTIFDDTSTLIRDNYTLTTAMVGNKTFVFVPAFYDDAVTVFQLTNAGAFVEKFTVLDNADMALDGARYVETAVVDGTTFLLVAGSSDSGISVFRVQNNGNLVSTDNVFDDGTLEISGVRSLEIVEIDGTTFVYAGGWNDSGISVFTLNDAGELSNVQNIPFGSLRADDLNFVEINGARMLFVSDSNTDAITAYNIESDGSLTLIGSVDDGDDPAFEFNGLYRSDIVEIDGNYFIIAPGEGDAGVSVFQIGGGDDALVGTNDADIVIGGAGDDDLLGRGGGDHLYGGDGVDVLLGRNGNDLLNGGKGADILIGGKGTNTADYSTSENGVTIDLAGGTASGGDANGDILIEIDNIFGSSAGDTLTGDSGKNRIEGNAGNDTINGGSGDDRLYGGAGVDDINGGGGNDFLYGGNGNDDLIGGGGADDLRGGNQRDTLTGGNGNDALNGNKGNDTLYGGAGDDTLLGAEGNDHITGGRGDDIMDGGAGSDVFHFVDGDGGDQIDNFQDGIDLIDVSGHGNVSSFSDFTIVQGGDDLLIIIVNPGGDNDLITLSDFDQSDIDATDFIF